MVPTMSGNSHAKNGEMLRVLMSGSRRVANSAKISSHPSPSLVIHMYLLKQRLYNNSCDTYMQQNLSKKSSLQRLCDLDGLMRYF
jgi:hypothetical protein